MIIFPAILLALFRSEFIVSDFFVKLVKDGDGFIIVDFYDDVYKYFSFINFQSFGSFLMWLLSSITAVLGLGALFSGVERHMRLGVPMGFKLISLINDSIVIVLPFVGLIFVSCEILGLVISGLICLLFLIIKSKIALFIVSLLLVAVVYLIYFSFVALISLTMPASLIDGYSFNYAAATSINLVKNNLFKITAALVFPLCLTMLSVSLFNVLFAVLLPGAKEIIMTIVWIFVYMFWMLYYPVMTVKHYMFLSGMEREDMSFFRRKG